MTTYWTELLDNEYENILDAILRISKETYTDFNNNQSGRFIYKIVEIEKKCG